MTAREAALKALGAYRRDKTRPILTTDGSSGKSVLSARETALATQIIKGVLQNLTLIDYYIENFSSIKLKKLQPFILDILRLSIYQIVFLEKIPYSAAVHEGVALAEKNSNPRAAGFVNAVLRKAANASEKDDLPEIIGDTPYKRLAIKYSHPEWLVRELCGVLGAYGGEGWLKANNESDTPVTMQVNTILTNTKEAETTLEAAGIRLNRHKWLDDCLELFSPGSIAGLQAHRKGHIYVQDAAARLAVIAAGPKPGDYVIDGCAAPGGKSFAAAIAMNDTGRIAAFDLTDDKLRLISEGAARLRLGIIEAIKNDASVADADYCGAADVVLADVPCSGFGVIRKKPEIRFKTESEIAGLPEIQKGILTNLSSYVKPGGTLLYSTCTVLKAENEDIINWFLDKHSEFKKEGFDLPGIGGVPDGMLTLWTQIHGTDGFFICKLGKIPLQ